MAIKKTKRTKGKPMQKIADTRTRWEKIRDNRLREFTAREIREDARAIDALASELTSLAESMDKQHIPDILVQGAQKLKRSKAELLAFVKNVQSAISDVQLNQKIATKND